MALQRVKDLLISRKVSARLRVVVVVEVVMEVTAVVVSGETLTGKSPSDVRRKSRIEFLNGSRPIRQSSS